MSRAASRRQAGELLERFALTEAADRLTKTYSDGMRRRLDLAASLVAKPQILFLDEPTAGLDPRSRLGLWEIVLELTRDGTTVLLTTQYLEEADHLANMITVLDEGRVIAKGTADELKSRSGGEVIHFRVADRDTVYPAAESVAGLGTDRPQVTSETGEVTLPVSEGASLLAEVVRRLDSAGLAVAHLELRQPTLDDVFLALTGRMAEAPPEGCEEEAQQARGD